jgi:hypothetical protein
MATGPSCKSAAVPAAKRACVGIRPIIDIEAAMTAFAEAIQQAIAECKTRGTPPPNTIRQWVLDNLDDIVAARDNGVIWKRIWQLAVANGLEQCAEANFSAYARKEIERRANQAKAMRQEVIRNGMRAPKPDQTPRAAEAPGRPVTLSQAARGAGDTG